MKTIFSYGTCYERLHNRMWKLDVIKETGMYQIWPYLGPQNSACGTTGCDVMQKNLSHVLYIF